MFTHQMLLFLVFMVAGTLVLGFNDVQKKKYLNQGIDEQVLLGVHLFIGGLILFPLLFLFGFPNLVEGFWLAYIGTTALNIISQNLFIRAFKSSEASLIAPLRLISPPLVIITGYFFLGEKPSLIGSVGIIVTMVGLWFLLSPQNPFSTAEFKKIKNERGVLLGLIGAVLFAVSLPLDKKAVVTSSALFASSLIFMSIGFITLCINFLRNYGFGRKLVDVVKNQPAPLFFTSLFLGGGAYFTNQALNYSLVAYGSSLKRLQALWTVILSKKFLDEKNIDKKLLATAIMFLGILLSVVWQ